SPVRADDRMALMHGCTNGSKQTISIFTFSWNSMTMVVPRYCSTISCSPPWPLTRVSVIPVTPARNSAALTSGRRSGRTIVVMSFITDKLAPGDHGVNQLVHRMHKFYVSQQSVTHSTLRAVTVFWQAILSRAAAAERPSLAAVARTAGRLTPSGDKPPAESCSGRSARKSPNPGRHRTGKAHVH